MSKDTADELFNGSIELVYEFALFFFLFGNADPKLLQSGELNKAELDLAYENGGKVLSKWKYLSHLVIEGIDLPGIIVGIEMNFQPEGRMTRVTWTFFMRPRNFLTRLLTAKSRREMEHSTEKNSIARRDLLRLKQNFEYREQTGLDEAFQDFRRRLHNSRVK